jgi:SnoaL-like domain
MQASQEARMTTPFHLSPRETVQRFWLTANARDWPAFAALLHPEMDYLVPQTRERARGRDAFVEVFRTWPGDWQARITTLVADEAGAATVIDFVVGGEASTGISFFEFTDGLVARVTDHWPEPYDPPPRASAHLKRY